MIRIERVYARNPVRRGEARILVDRVWPRGIARDELALDDWCRDVAPSNELRKWFGHDPDRWAKFRKRYVAELEAAPEHWKALLDLAAKKNVVLLYGARDEERNQAVVLEEFLTARI